MSLIPIGLLLLLIYTFGIQQLLFCCCFIFICFLFIRNSQGTMTNNEIHHHPLVKDEECKGSYTCEGCKMEGIGTRYKCSESCEFYLHLECKYAEKERTFQEQKFYLHTTPHSCTAKCRNCHACEKTVEGYLYHCSKTDQVFHPLCFPNYHPSHDHGLVKDEKCKDIYECNGCLMVGTGRRYRCRFQSCDFQLHFECMHAEKECTFQGQKCELLEKPNCKCRSCQKNNCHKTFCNACGERVKGFVYHCSETDQDFHPTCTKLKSKLSHEGVTFFLEEKATSSCTLCRRKMPEGNITRGWSYVSEHGECIHVCCVIALKNELSNEISKGDSSLPLAQRMKLPLQIKSKSGGTNSSSKWMKILKIILKTLISILIGDPTAIILSALDFVIKDG